MEQFSLAKYLENLERKIVTRDGRKIPVGLCKENGKYYSGRDDAFDLFVADENTRKHEGWMNLPALTPEEQGDLPHPFPIPVFEAEAKAREARKDVERCRLSISDYPHYILVKIEWEE